MSSGAQRIVAEHVESMPYQREALEIMFLHFKGYVEFFGILPSSPLHYLIRNSSWTVPLSYAVHNEVSP